MGSLGDADTQIKPMQDNQNPHSSYTDTQPFDSQIFPSSLPGEKGSNANEVQLVQSTVPFDDTIPIEDAFETQVVDLGDETQVPDDPLCLEHMDTQLIDDFNSDGEGTDKTQVLDYSDGFSDDESQGRGKCESLDGERSRHTSLEHSENILVEKPDENCSSRLNVSPETPTVQVRQEPKPGSIARFTSVRAASLRASGLAACRISLEGTTRGSCSLQTNNQHLEELAMENNGSNIEAWKEVDQVCGAGRYNNEVKGLINVHDCKIGRSTVRKLFDEGCFVENEEFASRNDNTAGGKEIHQFPTCYDGLAGLSYIDSQEPGELSQANAFACVRRLIEENKALFDKEFDLGKGSKGKLNFVSATKGPQSLAKKTSDRGTKKKTGIFDWDDEQEDEGGGDIFCRRKEEFLGCAYLGQRSFMKTQKANGKQLDRYTENKGKSDVQNEIVFQSDSKIVLHNTELNNKTAPEAEMNFGKNLVSEFDEQSDIATSAGQLEAGLARNQMPQVLDVGLDTQMAAEAMEVLLYGNRIAKIDANNVPGNSVSQKGSPGRKVNKRMPQVIGVATRQSKKSKRFGAKSNKQTSISSEKHSEIVRNGSDMDLLKTRRKTAKSNFEVSMTNGIKGADKTPSKIAGVPIERSLHDMLDGCHESALTGSGSVKKRNLPEEFATLVPIARRTRLSLVASQLKSAENVCSGTGETNCTIEISALRRNKAGASVKAAKLLDAKGKSSELVSRKFGQRKNFKSKLTTMSNGISCPRLRSCRQKSGQLNEPDNLDAQSKASTSLAELNTKRKTRSSKSICSHSSSLYQNFKEKSSPRSVDKSGSVDAALSFTSIGNGKKNFVDKMGAKEKLPDRKNNAYLSPSAKHEVMSDHLPNEATEPSTSMCSSPANYTTPVNSASPVCIGNEYFKQSCKKRLSRSCLMREVGNLCATGREPISALKDSRKRRDLANVRVLFSHHLDENTIKQQKKIVDRLRVSIASSITDATHFITDKFVRTRNMLEAIASGKPVVTHLWLENVGRANYYIDEQKYILRDMKKEKELGFNMPVSLAHARQHPLLRGRRVFITPSIKPGKDIISNLIKTVCGQAVERVGRSTLKDDVVPEDLLVLSCEEDYEVCVPFLEKGAAIYSSELLLNGIVTQKLEYERYQLFADHVKRTRSTIWLKKGGDDFIPVTKHK
ncbi:hypothetical protein P3X46_027769 [Hevea brasiliensis]|uniref:BRCT domain-containing protein n=2 Tax=Hevea brasiliensis TaxID=3981 RepID=A0ABQ9L3C3_HEVBR|nr:hypothetical protein P3X46_027769 [Hevea brasiliensis]